MEPRTESAETADGPASEENPEFSPHSIEALSEALAATKALSRESRIAVAAYYQAEKRGFVPGGELEDWLAAQRHTG
jgi:Protein of unknown function (DUF2934)